MIVCLSGGVGGAKLVLGLDRVLPADALVVAVNTGDDFVHLGLEIWPDFDTALYTLGAVAHAQQGWGRADETLVVMGELRALGGPDWFTLGDRDIALHLLRAHLRRQGLSATGIAADLRGRLGVQALLTPATDGRVATQVMTDDGVLDFQDYFVARRAEPSVRRLKFRGADQATLAAPVIAALSDPALDAILIAPSNPFLSIGPILALSGARAALRAAAVPVIAVTPIIADAAVKGPTAKIMRELGMPCSALAIAQHYGDLLDGFVLDECDAHLAPEIEALGLTLLIEQTMMRTDDDKVRLAERVAVFAGTCPLRR